jgi:[ribosomal protein S5]-alanine N-acetyltransferase
MHQLSGFPRIETERLILRLPTLADLPLMVTLANDPDVTDGTMNMPFPYLEKNAINWLNRANEGFEKRDVFIFAMELKENGQFIGGTGFTVNERYDRAELGYWIGKSYWNKGYCTESLAAMIKFGFENTSLNKFMATHYPHNSASGRVMEKCGMIKEGELVQHVKKGDRYLDLVQYRMTRDEFKKFRS